MIEYGINPLTLLNFIPVAKRRVYKFKTFKQELMETVKTDERENKSGNIQAPKVRKAIVKRKLVMYFKEEDDFWHQVEELYNLFNHRIDPIPSMENNTMEVIINGTDTKVL